jgi:acyl-coenzyme A thioesterase PaaI-like protein
VFATTQLTPVDTQRILDEVARTGKTDAPIAVEVVDAVGEPVAQATVTMSVRRMG